MTMEHKMNLLSCIMLVALSCISSIAFAQEASPEKVAQVAKGELKEARASWWGFNAEDSTDALATAIHSKVPKLIIDKMPTPWITAKTLIIPSDIEIVFEEGAELQAKRGCFHKLSACLISIADVKNVILRGLGTGAMLKMHKADYHSDAYQKSEWRHCIELFNCENVRILNLTLKESGGDGIYFGCTEKLQMPRNIIVRDVICDGNNRQGISVIAGVDCLIENCKLINTWGTPPAAGIDFEPNKPGEPIRNFVLRNVESYNNQGAGFAFYLPNMDKTSGPLEITMENCTSRNEGSNPFYFVSFNGPGYDRPGLVHVKNCTFEDCPQSVRLTGTCAYGFKVLFENVTIRNVATKNEKHAPIEAGLHHRNQGVAGNFHFINTNVYDTIDRPPFKFTNGGQCGGLENVSGTINGYLNGELKHTVTLTDEWAKQNYPKKQIIKYPMVDLKDFVFEPLTPNAAPQEKEFDHIRVRGTGRWVFLAQEGDTFKLSAQFGPIGKNQIDFANVAIVTPSGKNLDIGKIPFRQTADFVKENLPETGLYELVISSGACWSRVVRCNLPIGVKMSPKDPNFCMGTGDAYFYVPKNTKAFTIDFYGEENEGLKVTVFGPDGKQLWQQDDIVGLQQFIGKGKLAKKGGVFKLRIERPTHFVIEDYYIGIRNIPSILGLSPELLIKSTPK